MELPLFLAGAGVVGSGVLQLIFRDRLAKSTNERLAAMPGRFDAVTPQLVAVFGALFAIIGTAFMLSAF